MIIGGPTTRILGLFALIAAGGCGSRSGRSNVPPMDASAALVPATVPPAVPLARVPSTIEPDFSSVAGAALPPPVMKAKEGPPPVPGLRRSFDAPLRAPAVATGDTELDPLVSYLKASFAAAIKGGCRLVIGDTTDVKMLHLGESYQDMVDGLLKEASDQVPAEMIRDFAEKNRESHAVWPELARDLPASLLTRGEAKAIFEVDREGWKRFYAKYPGSPGIIIVSRVGVNRDKTLAFFYVELGCGMLCGHGQIHVLKKEGDAWVELPIDILGPWTA